MTSVLPSRPGLRSVSPLPSSTVLLLADRAGRLEVLMVRRSRSAVFGGMFVFPGGVVDPVDLSPLAEEVLVGVEAGGTGWRAAGLRETAEEVGVYLTDRPIDPPPTPLRGEEIYRWVASRRARFDARRLRYLSNWVTPHEAPQRFDARFYLARVEGDEALTLAEGELTEAVWVGPRQALDRLRRGEWEMILPTERTLEYLADFSKTQEAWESVQEAGEVTPVLPRIVIRRGRPEALLPGEPGYEEAG
ncbi:MAG: NUDIX domain-containing protein [bacterium]|nr:NUDIX domain-containing protein [bacterium]MDE0600752.1 NUDIX domain-containing protein [bacterium]